jgi:desulfoferrodoxin (superoxide reductase-like protein)
VEHRKKILCLVIVLMVLLGFDRDGLANMSSVTIEAPATAVKGSEILIKVNVSHAGNSFMHYTDWVYVKVNDKEIARWQFTSTNRPDAEKFSREVKIRVDDALSVVAEAHCNIHGSAGPAKLTVTAN